MAPVSLPLRETRGRGGARAGRLEEKKDGSWEKEDHRVVDTAHCHCYSPLQKMAASIKPLMIPALCRGAGASGSRCASEGETGSDAEQR